MEIQQIMEFYSVACEYQNIIGPEYQICCTHFFLVHQYVERGLQSNLVCIEWCTT